MIFLTNFHFSHCPYCLPDNTISAAGILINHPPPVILDFVFVDQQELTQQLQSGSSVVLSSLRSLLAPHGESLVVSRPTIYRSLEKMRRKLWTKTIDAYSMLSDVLRQYHHQNPASTAVLPVDSKDWFYRMLVALPSFADLFKSLCFPMLHLDGAFSKNPLYDGSVLMLFGKLGNGGLLPLVV
jgi:hypothetical protein